MAKNISSKTPETKIRTIKDKLKIDCKTKHKLLERTVSVLIQ